ncbi:hypothetical protein GCM10009573_12000 [Agromyces bracchium]
MNQREDMIQALIVCRNGHEHRVCVPALSPGVPHPLRCPHAQHGGGGGAVSCLPAELAYLVDRELRENRSESIRRGFVLVRV